MSRTLTLTGDGLAVAAELFQTGRMTEAGGVLAALVGGTDSPIDRVKVLRAAAQVAVAQERYRRARRLLREAVRLAPTDAGLLHDLGMACEDDPRGCDLRAARYYRKATKLNSDDPNFRASLGRAMVRINETTSGVKQLLRAADAAPADADVLAVVAEGLTEAGRAGEAFRVLSQARFLAPACGRIQKLWQRARFDLVAEDQRGPTRPAPQVIPMLRVFSAQPIVHASASLPRRDGAQTPAPHITRLRAFRGDHG